MQANPDPWPQPDQPPPFRPPEPQPYQEPDWRPSQRPPFEPPGTPNPTDPTRNPWQSPGTAIAGFVVAVTAFLLLPGLAHAAAAGGGGTMPWDTPLTNLRTDLTGSTATAISLIGIVAVFGVLIFGGEMNHFFRTLCYIILLVSVLVAGQNIITDLGITGATVNGHAALTLIALAAGAILIAGAILPFAIRLLRRLPQFRKADNREDAQ
jgi:type IV secretion system protein TrbC